MDTWLSLYGPLDGYTGVVIEPVDGTHHCFVIPKGGLSILNVDSVSHTFSIVLYGSSVATVLWNTDSIAAGECWVSPAKFVIESGFAQLILYSDADATTAEPNYDLAIFVAAITDLVP